MQKRILDTVKHMRSGCKTYLKSGVQIQKQGKLQNWCVFCFVKSHTTLAGIVIKVYSAVLCLKAPGSHNKIGLKVKGHVSHNSDH